MLYGLIDSMFDVFNFLAKVNLFSNDNYSEIVKRIYIILGLIMLFALSYSLLKAVINPDEFSKGENSFPKLIKNVTVSLVIIAILPTVFSFAFNAQNAILNQNTIPRLIMGESYNEDNNSDSGRMLAYNMFSAFLHVNEEYCTNDASSDVVKFDETMAKTCAQDINSNKSNAKWYTPWRLLNTKETFEDVDSGVKSGDIDFANYNKFGGISCYADRINYANINYDGNVYKCTAQDYTSETALGFLDENGQIRWDKEKTQGIDKQAFFDNQVCLNCKYLAICGGPCFYAWWKCVRNKNNIECPNKKDKLDIDLPLFIREYYLGRLKKKYCN